MPQLGQPLDPSQYTVVGEVDPKTFQPIQQPLVSNRPVTNQQQGNQSFNIDQYAANSAADQMNWARSKGAVVTMEDFENARKAAYQQAGEFQRQLALQQEREKTELQKEVTLKNYEEVMPKRMSGEQLDKVSGLLTAGNTIMNLYNLHQDANNVPGYGQAVIGGATQPLYNATDQRVRLYNSAREGSMVALARGIMEDTGAVAGKESSQAQIREMLPNEGDNKQMGGIKTASMLQMVLDKEAARIRSLKADNVMTAPLEDSYRTNYQNYLNMVNQYGTDAQKQHPAASPDELFGTGGANQTFLKTGQAASLIPAPTQVGVSNSTNAALNAVNTPDYLAGRVPQLPSDDVWNKAAATANQATQDQFASQITPESDTATAGNQRFQQTPDMMQQAVQNAPSTLGSIINWLGIGQPMQVKPGVTSNN